MSRLVPTAIFLLSLLIHPAIGSANELADAGATSSMVIEDDFDSGIDQWELLDPVSWSHETEAEGGFMRLGVKEASYEPPHRSPRHVAMLKDVKVTDFELTLRIRSTTPDYPHRDVCLFFGWQDPTHFYYVHLGKQGDPRCNQIFIVDEAPRTMITEKQSPGTPWDDQWHTVRLVRNAKSGEIAVYWEDDAEPIMTAVNKRFTWGRIGVGAFDDTADYDDLQLEGSVATDHP